MNDVTPSRGVAIGLLTATVAASAIWFLTTGPGWREIPFLFAVFSLAITGWLLAVRRPGHSIGWLLLTAGLMFAIASAAEWIVQLGPSPEVNEVILSVVLFAGLGLVLGPLLVLFPTGRPPNRRWWWVVWAGAAYVPAAVIGNLWIPSLVGVAAFFLFGSLAGGVASLVRRFRVGDSTEREQLKWFISAAALLPIAVMLGELPNQFLQATTVPVAMGLLPIAIAVAVLRYRLYEIDRIISRTVTYGVLTAVLAGVYLGAVFVLGRVLPSQDELAVAGSTLLAAALFTPLRQRVQGLVDRRFNRSRYDSEATMESFSRHLASQVNLGQVARELELVAGATMQPANLSVWVRERT